jgi:hypothetical protein
LLPLDRWNHRPTFLFHVRLRADIGARHDSAHLPSGACLGAFLTYGMSSGRGAAARGARLSFEDDRDRRRKTDTAAQADTAPGPKAKKKRGSSPEVGHALRAAYQQAVSEDIPPEMLDLLGKLG